MAQAKRCDRCGTFYEVEEMNAIQTAIQNISESFYSPKKEKIRKIAEYLDLCCDCKEALKKWLEGEQKTENNQAAFRESIELYIKDLTDGTVRKYGTDCHDALFIRDGVIEYENFQNGDGSPSGYCFCYEDGGTDGLSDSGGHDERYIHIGIIANNTEKESKAIKP